MARLPRLNDINLEKIRVLNLSRANDESLLLTTDETKLMLEQFLREELNHFAHEISEERRAVMQGRIMVKFEQIEDDLKELINSRFDALTERVVEEIISRKIREEVENRLNEKLEKIKKSL